MLIRENEVNNEVKCQDRCRTEPECVAFTFTLPYYQFPEVSQYPDCLLVKHVDQGKVEYGRVSGPKICDDDNYAFLL